MNEEVERENEELRAELVVCKRKLETLREMHSCKDGDASCREGECMTLGVIDCPHGEPLHNHHDGCPICDGKEKEALMK